MGELPHFRTAVGGFHKSDVAAYIAAIAKEHQSQLQEKDKVIQQLQQQLDHALEQLHTAAAEAASEPTAPEPQEVSSEDSLDRIFERFYRVDKSHSREIGGTGLGLAITRSTITMHHGVVKVFSKEGEGTTFSVRVPLSYIP